MPQNKTLCAKISRRESIFAFFYFVLCMAYLFATLENEVFHWVSLVVLPLGFIFVYQRATITKSNFASTLASVGIAKSRIHNGLGLAIIMGLGISLLQVGMSESATKIVSVFFSGKFVVLMPLAFFLMLVTAGFTEEFFFRGVLQTRFQVLLGSNTLAIVLTAVCFGLYHLPYALLSPNWPTNGNFAAALASALLQGGIGGLILGWLYVRSEDNLVACAVAHSLMNTLPIMTMIRFGG